MSVKILKENNMKDLMKLLQDRKYSIDDLKKAQTMIDKNKKLYDSLDTSLKTTNDPNQADLPDGSKQKMAFISNDPNHDHGYMIIIGGDIDGTEPDTVYVLVEIYNDEDEFFAYVSEFDYYENFGSAVKLANNLVGRIKPEMSDNKVAEICEKLGMERG